MSESQTRGDDNGGRRGDDAAPKPSASEVRAELERILKSRCFQQAGRASEFLRFVVEQTLAGAGQRLKGYTIGVEVFGRPADFDAQSDALVRVEAGRLRRRLIEYYASEGAADPVRIELPRGSYAVEYRFARPEEWAVSGQAEPPAQPWGAARDPVYWPLIAFGLAALLVAAVGVITWQQSVLREATRPPEVVEAPPQRSEWPRVVVVPFENLSPDRELDAVAASLTEEIMLQLAQFDLFVVASQARWYRAHEQTLDVAVGTGAYVLTGSVRGSGARARITARLIKGRTGQQLWTAVYDEPLAIDRLPALQERVARDVAAVAAPYGPIFEAELARARRGADEPKLRDCLATYHEYRRLVVSSGYEETLKCYLSVSAREPNLARAWSGLAMLYVDEYASSMGRTGDSALAAARAATAKALALDANDFLANLALVRVQFFAGDPEFKRSIERTLALRPNGAQAYAQGGFLLVITGDSARGLALAEKARELRDTPLGFYHLTRAVSQLRDGHFDAALTSALAVDRQSWVFAQAVLAAAAAHAGRYEVAHDAAERVRELYPNFENEALTNFERWHFDGELYRVLVSGLRAAGLDLRGERPVLSGG